MRIEGAIRAGKHDTSITKNNKAIGPITLVRRKIAEEILTSKMMQLGFVVIDDSWSYDPNGCLSKRNNAIKHEPQNSWLEHTNPRVDDPNLYVGPDDFPVLRRPPMAKVLFSLAEVQPREAYPSGIVGKHEDFSLV